jgi:hypothetical protein
MKRFDPRPDVREHKRSANRHSFLELASPGAAAAMPVMAFAGFDTNVSYTFVPFQQILPTPHGEFHSFKG